MSVIASGCGTTGGGGGAGDVTGPASATDNAAVRFNGATGKLLQDSLVTIADDGTVDAPALNVSGDTALQDFSASSGQLGFLEVDNLRLDGNTVSAVNANGQINIVPNGTGAIGLFGATSSDPGLKRRPSSSQLELTNGDGTGRSLLWLAGAYFNSTGSNYGSNAVVIGVDLGLAASVGIGWASAADAAQAKDAGMKRASAGVLLDTDGDGGGLGLRLTGRPVEASTAGSGAPNLLAATESRKLLTNEGATAEAYNALPTSAPVGYEQAFYCQDADGIRIVAPTGCTIRLGPGSVSAAAGFVRSVTVGSALTLIKINSTEFVCLAAPLGTWLIDL